MYLSICYKYGQCIDLLAYFGTWAIIKALSYVITMTIKENREMYHMEQFFSNGSQKPLEKGQSIFPTELEKAPWRNFYPTPFSVPSLGSDLFSTVSSTITCLLL